MRYAILGLILLIGCTRDLPPLDAERLGLQIISGEQWLRYDLENRRAVALELHENVISRKRHRIEGLAALLVWDFQTREQELKEYECVDQPQEVCDQDTVALSNNLTRICEILSAGDCSSDGISAAGDEFVERELREPIDIYNCAMQIETLDRVAQTNPKSPVLLAALESCGWNEETTYD